MPAPAPTTGQNPNPAPAQLSFWYDKLHDKSTGFYKEFYKPYHSASDFGIHLGTPFIFLALTGAYGVDAGSSTIKAIKYSLNPNKKHEAKDASNRLEQDLTRFTMDALLTLASPFAMPLTVASKGIATGVDAIKHKM